MTILVADGAFAGVLQPLAFGAAASLATLLGGVLGLRLSQRIALVLGLAAGVVLGVALFNLIPEALAIAPHQSARGMLAWVTAGIGGYMLFERVLRGAEPARRWRAHLGPATVSVHSLLDGLGIGLAFQVPRRSGILSRWRCSRTTWRTGQHRQPVPRRPTLFGRAGLAARERRGAIDGVVLGLGCGCLRRCSRR